MEIKKVPISEVDLWQDNPWNIRTADYEELKEEITELGIYKPLICCKEDNRWLCLGGNKRLLVLKELGHKEVDISVVHPNDYAEKLKYAFSDNSLRGVLDKQKIAEITIPHIHKIQIERFKLHVDEPISLKKIIEEFAPDSDGGEGNIPKMLVCPECGAEFSPQDAKK